ncbi:hypothetical protein R1sor_021182 [Riccia sorocarpa]|uniref:Ribosomal RNA-processing protein 42 n=1 Tax=Riccia sorocarpa TaxID=122646 RepID=A0ABD3GHZ0_9MARC
MRAGLLKLIPILNCVDRDRVWSSDTGGSKRFCGGDGGGFVSAEKNYIAGGTAVDLPGDGRDCHHFREFNIDTSANGSARVCLGGTDVIASVKPELSTPPLGRPHHGKMEISVEFSPTAAPEFEGNYAVTLHIDGLVLSSDGNLLDSLSIAMKAPLSNCGLPKVDIIGGTSPEEEPDYELSGNPEECTRLETCLVPVIVTLTKVGKHYIVDATAEEEPQMTEAVSVAANRKGTVCGLTKHGGAGLDTSVLLDMISVAKRISQSLNRCRC